MIRVFLWLALLSAGIAAVCDAHPVTRFLGQGPLFWLIVAVAFVVVDMITGWAPRIARRTE